ncbi:MAG: CAP domain-containing protein [Burkholderiaceae bacterium]
MSSTLCIAACGGAGQESVAGQSQSAASATAPTSSPVSFPSLAGLPASTSTAAGNNLSQAEIDCLNRVNDIRAVAGLAPVTADFRLNSAAQKHSTYQLETGTYGHGEPNNAAPSFTGASIVERVALQGYAWNRLLEVTAAAKPIKSSMALHDMLMDAVYHRIGMLRHDLVNLGVGYAVKNNSSVLTLNYGRPKSLGLTPSADGAPVRWPVDGQINVPVDFASDNEAPDPVPDMNVVGYPISLQVYPDVPLTTLRFRLFEAGAAGVDTEIANTRLLTSASDANLENYAVTIIPLTPLKAGTIYKVVFEGQISGQPKTLRWQFKTA